MRKHFLILMLLALLPLASWAEDAVVNDDLAKQTDWTYDATAKAIVTAGTANVGTITFAVTATDVAPAATAASTWYALGDDALKRKDAGTYYAWYKVVHSGNAGDDIAPTLIGEVVVSKATLTITPTAYGEKVYGATDYASLNNFYAISTAAGGSGGFYEGDNATSEGLAVTGTITSWTKDHAVSVDENGAPKEQTYTVTARDTKNYKINVDGDGTITIKPATLTVKADDKETIAYGGTIPTWTATYTGLIAEDKTVVDGKDMPKANKLGGALTYTVKTAGNVDISTQNAGAYIITPSGYSTNNYTITYETGSFTITAKELTSEDITIEGLDAVKYKGAAYEPTVTVKYGDKVLVKGTDYNYTVKDPNSTAISESNPIKNVGDYTFTFIGSGNYQGTLEKIFTVQKAALTLKFANVTKTYNAKGGITQEDLGAGKSIFELLTLKGDDTEADYNTSDAVTNLKALTAFNTTDKFVGKYDIKVDKSAADAVFTNYDCIIAKGTLEIKPAKLKLKGKANQSKKYGQADPTTIEYVYEGLQNAGTSESPNVDDIALVLRNIGTPSAARYANAVRAQGETIGKYPITVSGAQLRLKTQTGDDANALGNNYEIVYDNSVEFEIKANDTENIVITVFPKSRPYDGTGDDLEFNNPVEGEDYMVTGLTFNTDKVTDVKLKRAPGKDRGQYDLEVVSAKLPTGYSKIEYNNSTFTITPKEVTVVVADQTVKATAAAATAPVLNQNLVTIDGLVAGETAVKPKTGDSDTNVNAYTLSIDNTVVTDFTAVNSYPNAITFAFAQPTKANYVVKKIKVGDTEQDDITKGTLIIAEAANNLILDRDDADLANKIKVAAEACGEGVNEDGDPTVLYTVNFAARNLKAEQWYALTLPFKTSVSELSSKLGYAVVNILDETNADATKVRFKLWMQDIEANQPFLIKVFNEKTDANNSNMNAVTFTKKFIVNEDGAFDHDAALNKFIGTYKSKELEAGKNFWIINGGKFQKVVTTANIKPIVAYLQTAQDLNSFAPAIYVEDVDGEVTAINNVNYTKLAGQNDGWYTVNGVKLTAAPTEKGVYIRDGKKVIIK